MADLVTGRKPQIETDDLGIDRYARSRSTREDSAAMVDARATSVARRTVESGALDCAHVVSLAKGYGYRRRFDFDRVYGIRFWRLPGLILTTMSDTLTALDTPALILDMDKAERNVARLTKRLTRLGVTLRPHVKTAKSIDVVRRLFQDQRGPITVSTVKEAEYFADWRLHRYHLMRWPRARQDRARRHAVRARRRRQGRTRHSRSSTSAGGRRVSCAAKCRAC